MTEPIIVLSSDNQFVKKMKHFCLEQSNLYFSFFHVLHRFLFLVVKLGLDPF